MRDIHAVPRYMGFILIGVGLVFIVPMLAMVHIMSIPDLWSEVTEKTGWSIVMIGFVGVGFTIIALMLAFGTEIIWYHDRNDPD